MWKLKEKKTIVKIKEKKKITAEIKAQETQLWKLKS